MYRKVLLGGVTAAVIVGSGGTALALTGSDTPTPGSGSGSSSNAKHSGAKHKHARKGAKMLRHTAHGQFVVKGKDGKFVTHDLITGTVTSVSSSSITVQAADNKTEKFAVTDQTKIRERTVGQKSSDGKHVKGSASPAKISDIARGDHVVVAGTGSTDYQAEHVVEIKGAK